MQLGKCRFSMEHLTEHELDMFESIVNSLHLVDSEKISTRKLSDTQLLALAALVRDIFQSGVNFLPILLRNIPSYVCHFIFFPLFLQLFRATFVLVLDVLYVWPCGISLAVIFLSRVCYLSMQKSCLEKPLKCD